MTKERLIKFLEKSVFPNYKNNLIILDNAGSHNNTLVKDAITESENKYLFSVPYSPETNSPIEQFFNQLKHYLKLNKKISKFDNLKNEIKNIIDTKIKRTHHRNYFNHAYKKTRKNMKNKSTRIKTLKNYKLK